MTSKEDVDLKDQKMSHQKDKVLVGLNNNVKGGTPEISIYSAVVSESGESSNSVSKLSTSTSSLVDISPSSSTPSSPSFLQTLLGNRLGFGFPPPRTRALSESQTSNVSVDLSPWLQDGHNARDLKVGRQCIKAVINQNIFLLL